MPDAASAPLADVVRCLAETARAAWEPVWPVWKRFGGCPGSAYSGSRDTCIPTSCAMRRVLDLAVPELRWRVAGGRPTARTPRGGFFDATGTSHPHLWVEGRRRGAQILVDLTADQFGGPPVVVEEGDSPAYLANATGVLLARYEQHEDSTVCMFVQLFDLAMRRGWTPRS